MYIIKNRVTGEYDKRGMYSSFHKIERSAWSKLSHAKNHVAQKVNSFRIDHGNLNWYLDADFIEITEEGTGNVIPVVSYLKEYLCDIRSCLPQLTPDEKRKLGLE